MIRLQRAVIALQGDDRRLLTQTDGDFVLQLDGLHQRPEIVEPIPTTVQNPEDKIDLGGSENGNR
jgi:hypothetical protein